MIGPRHVYTPYIFLFVLVTLLDRITKSLVLQMPEAYQVTDWLSFSLQYNRGIATGLLDFQSSAMFIGLTILIGLFIVGFAIYTWSRWLNYFRIYPEVLVLAGALSNFVDRLLYPGVIDFIAIHFSTWTFPVFNIADASIVVGVGLMFIYTYIDPE